MPGRRRWKFVLAPLMLALFLAATSLAPSPASGQSATWTPVLATYGWDFLDFANEPPLARRGFAMGYDPRGGNLIVFGGIAGDQVLDDTWILSMETLLWRRIDTDIRPAARHGMVAAMGCADGCIVTDPNDGWLGTAAAYTGNAGNRTNIFDITAPWALDLTDFTWAPLETKRSRHSLPGTPLGMYKAWGGVDVYHRDPTQFVIGGGWDNDGYPVSMLYMLALDSMEWAILPLPTYEPFRSPENPNPVPLSDIANDSEDNTDPFSMLARPPGPPTTGVTELQLLGASAFWVQKDGQEIYLFGGCLQDRTGRTKFLYGNTEFVTDDESGCVVRNPVVIRLPTPDKLSSNRTTRPGTWSVMPQRCMGARKYATMVVLSSQAEPNAAVIYGGQGYEPLFRGDGIPASIGLLQRTTGSFQQVEPASIAQDVGVPMNREGHTMVPFVENGETNLSFVADFRGTAFMYSGLGENESLLRRLWVLYKDPPHTESAQIVESCSIRTAPVLALRESFFTTRLISLHGIHLFLIFAVLVPIDLIVLFGLWSKRIRSRNAIRLSTEGSFSRKEVLRSLGRKQQEWLSSHRTIHLISTFFMLFGLFYIFGAVQPGKEEWFYSVHAIMGSFVLIGFLFLLVSGLSLWWAGKNHGVSFGLLVVPELEDAKQSDPILPPPRLSRLRKSLSYWFSLKILHILVGYGVYAFGIVAIYLGIFKTLFHMRVFYILWTTVVVIAVSIVGVYRFGLLHAYVPGFPWVDRRIRHLTYEYQTYFQTVIRNKRTGMDGEDATLTLVASDSAAVELESLPNSGYGSAPPHFGTRRVVDGNVAESLEEVSDAAGLNHQNASELLSRLCARYSTQNGGPHEEDGDEDGWDTLDRRKGATYRGKLGRFAPIHQILGFGSKLRKTSLGSSPDVLGKSNSTEKQQPVSSKGATTELQPTVALQAPNLNTTPEVAFARRHQRAGTVDSMEQFVAVRRDLDDEEEPLGELHVVNI